MTEPVQENAITEEIETDGIGDVENTIPPTESTEHNQFNIDEPEDEEFKVPNMDDKMEDNNDSDELPAEKKEKVSPKEKEKDTGDEEDKQPEKQEEKIPEKISDELLDKAKKLGISDEDIAAFDKPAQLEKLCSLMEPKKTSETAEKPEIPYEDGDFKLELDEDLYDPEICNAMKSTASQINGIKKALSDVLGAIQRQSTASFEQNFESMVNVLDDNFTDILGKGDVEDIGRDSEHYKNRCSLMREMNALAAGYIQTGKQVPKQKVLFEKALNSAFGDKLKAGVRKDIASQLEKRSGQFISRPSGKKGKDSLTPEQVAANNVRDKLRDYGVSEQTEQDEDF